MVYELCRTVLRKRGTRSLNVRRPRLELLHAIELLVKPLEGSSKNLFALQRLIGRSRKALAARLGFPAQLPLFLPRQRTLLAALLPQARLQSLQLVRRELVDGRVMRAANKLELVVAEPVALRFTGHRHLLSSWMQPQWSVTQSACEKRSCIITPAPPRLTEHSGEVPQ